MLSELIHYEIQTLNGDSVWVHQSFEKPEYVYEEHTITKRWWVFGYSFTRRVCVNEHDTRVRTRKHTLRKARQLNKQIPTRVLITVRFRGHEGVATYEIWDRGRYLA